MRGSNFWRKMESRFLALSTEYGDGLEANWAPAPLEGGERRWSFFGSAGDRELKRFKLLAGRAAVKLGGTDGEGAVRFWLDCLRAESPHRTDGPLITHYDARGGSVTEQYEVIAELHKASAAYCLQMVRKEEAARLAATGGAD